MKSSQTPHPDDQTLKAYGLGKLVDEQASTVDTHLETCPDCRQRLSGFTSDSFLGRFREAHQPSARSIPVGSLVDGTISFMQAKVATAPPSADTIPPGLANHPDYEIKRELGRGGMGVVYLAHNTMMGRDEVLKVLGRHIMERPGVLERFQREIRAVAKLRHPNIVAAYHAFRIEGGLVFSMEYVEGLDLARLVKAKGPLTVAQATYFIHQAALGLQHAHEKGLIHRDIKPHNLMLTHDGKARVVKVLDFGLAKATREQTVDGGLTSEGQALGTPDYIAPEQIVNAIDVDIRADLYSLGGTLFYLLTGRPPFQCNSLYDVYQAHMSRDADPLNLIRPEVPAELAALVAKMMAKEPKRRFQTPDEVAEALTPFFKPKAVSVQAKNSQVAPVEPRALKTVEKPASSEPAANTGIPDHRPKKLGESPETQWESLIDFREPESQSKLVPSVVGRSSRPRWLWPTVAAAMLLLSGLTALTIGVLKVKTEHGTIVIENLPSDGEVFVDEGRVQITPSKGGEPLEVSIQPGEYKANVRVGPHKLVVRRGTDILITRDATIKWAGHEVPIRIEEPKRLPDSNPRVHDKVVVGTPPDGTTQEERGPATTDISKEDRMPKTPSETTTKAVVDGKSSLDSISLFNGKNLDGWIFPFGNQDDWKIQNDGVIRGCSTRPNSTIATNRSDFANFRLSLRIRSSDDLNKHFLIRTNCILENQHFYKFGSGGQRSDGRHEHLGEYYVKSGGNYSSTEQLDTDGLKSMVLPRSAALSKNTWYEIRIEAIGNTFRMYVDDKEVSAFRDTNSRYSKGRIAFSLRNGSQIEISKIEIMELSDREIPEPAKSSTKTSTKKSTSTRKNDIEDLPGVKDALQARTTWIGEYTRQTPGQTPVPGTANFTILSRQGDEFTAELVYSGSRNVTQIVIGRIQRNRVTWNIEGRDHTYTGKINRGQMLLEYFGTAITDGQPVSGILRLDLKE